MLKFHIPFIVIFLFSFPALSRVKVSERALIVISELNTYGIPELEPLYRALERLTTLSVDQYLENSYRKIIYLTNNDATFEKLIIKSKELALDSKIKAIDVILSLHGSPDRLYFANKSWSMSALQNKFFSQFSAQEENLLRTLRKKFRIMYNLSCYGVTHNQAFLNLGFDVSTGSKKVNANSEVEFLGVLYNWKNYFPFKEAFEFSNNDWALFLADEPIRRLGEIQNSPALKQVDSKKIFLGRVQTRITSDPL
jgi:hypothetical protein